MTTPPTSRSTATTATARTSRCSAPATSTSSKASTPEPRNWLIEDWLYDNAAVLGWYAGPYSNGGASQETILRNTFGLKNIVGMLSENRGGAGLTRPEATEAENENRKSYGQLWLAKQVLRYHLDNVAAYQSEIAESIAFQKANVGPIVFRGSYPWPVFPPLPSAPDVDPIMGILEDPPCGYFLTREQFSGARPGGTVKERLQLHGIDGARPAPDRVMGPGRFILMNQPVRGLIPLLLDGAAAEPMVDGVRLYMPTTPEGEPLPGGECGFGPTVATAGINVAYDLTYDTH